MVLQWNFVADDIKLIFSISNMNNIVDIKLQPNNSWHSSNQTNTFTSNVRTNQKNKPIDFGTCRNVKQ